MRRRWLKWTLIMVGGLLVAGFAGLSFVAGGPGNVYGLVRYALPHMHRGTLRVGDAAPDARLYALDGTTFPLHDRLGARPLVLIFGSYT
jgi:hypothetical protein